MKRIIDFVRMVIILGLLAYSAAYFAYRSSEEVIGRALVIDGDSIKVEGREIRLEGIDAPEYRQRCLSAKAENTEFECGKQAASYLRQLVSEGEVECISSGSDKYDRLLATCRIGNVSLNQSMVKNGWAVSFGDYEADEAEAKSERRGLWRGEFVLPSDWRRERAEENNSNWLKNLFQ